MGVEPGAHGGPAERELQQAGQGLLEPGDAVVELLRPARDLLPERQRRRVHQVRAADLHDVVAGRGPLPQRVAQRRERRDHLAPERDTRRHVDRGGEAVVRGLAAVHVVVRVHETLLAPLAAQELARAVRQHLVHVHVRLRAAAGLPHHERELVVPAAREHLVRRRDDGAALRRVEQPELDVDERRRLLHLDQRAHQRTRHALARDAEPACASARSAHPTAAARRPRSGRSCPARSSWRRPSPRPRPRGTPFARPAFGKDSATTRIGQRRPPGHPAGASDSLEGGGPKRAQKAVAAPDARGPARGGRGRARGSSTTGRSLRVTVKPFVVKDLDGKALSLADLGGKIAVHRLLGHVVQALRQGAARARRVPPAARGPGRTSCC